MMFGVVAMLKPLLLLRYFKPRPIRKPKTIRKSKTILKSKTIRSIFSKRNSNFQFANYPTKAQSMARFKVSRLPRLETGHYLLHMAEGVNSQLARTVLREPTTVKCVRVLRSGWPLQNCCLLFVCYRHLLLLGSPSLRHVMRDFTLY